MVFAVAFEQIKTGRDCYVPIRSHCACCRECGIVHSSECFRWSDSAFMDRHNVV